MFLYYALVNAGLWHDILNWGIGAVLGFLLARVPWRRHKREQARLMDRLDAETPGGLGDIAQILKQEGFASLAANLTDKTEEAGE